MLRHAVVFDSRWAEFAADLGISQEFSRLLVVWPDLDNKMALFGRKKKDKEGKKKKQPKGSTRKKNKSGR